MLKNEVADYIAEAPFEDLKELQNLILSTIKAKLIAAAEHYRPFLGTETKFNVLWVDDGTYYPAKLLRITPTGLIDVRFEPDAEETDDPIFAVSPDCIGVELGSTFNFSTEP